VYHGVASFFCDMLLKKVGSKSPQSLLNDYKWFCMNECVSKFRKRQIMDFEGNENSSTTMFVYLSRLKFFLIYLCILDTFKQILLTTSEWYDDGK
jgi:hypothetical protein